MADNDSGTMTTQQDNKDMNLNPTGKGGFGDHPENRNPGGWRKEVSFSYQYKRFMAMTIPELEAYATTPKEQRTVVEDLAYSRVVAAKMSLPDIKEITDRTEGKAPQSIAITTEDPRKAILEKYLGEDNAGQTQEAKS